MSILSLLLLISGFVLLVMGGQVLVRGAASLGKSVGLSSLVIGLTIVAFATSAPELAVSVGAAVSGAPGLAIGNVVGSNIVNVLFVLGLTAMFGALTVKVQLIKADIPVMIGFSVLALVLAADGRLSTTEGAALLTLLVLYVVIVIWWARRRRAAGDDPQLGLDEVLSAGAGGRVSRWIRGTTVRSTTADGILIAAGVVLLVIGAQLLISSATTIATSLGVSDLIIGLTVVAIGTSLPELATSIIAALRGERDMAVGNLVGSNIFNIGAVLGLSSIVSPAGISVDAAAINFDFPVMIAVAMVLLPLALNGQAITRWEGALLVCLYVAYVVYLVLSAADHQALRPFSAAMLWFVLPISAVWVMGMAGCELTKWRSHRLQEEPSASEASPTP